MKKNLLIFSNVEIKDKKELFHFLSKKAYENKIVKKQSDFMEALEQREKVGTTGLENHIAIPHAISEKITKQFILVVCLKKTITYQTLDGSDVKSIICLAVPKNKQEFHLDVLQKISIMLLKKENQDILNSGKIKSIETIFLEAEKEIDNKSNFNDKQNLNNTEHNVQDNENDLAIEENENILSKIKNLIIQKKDLQKDYKISKDEKLFLEIKEIDLKIQQCKTNIKDLRISLKNDNKLLKSNFKNEYSITKQKIQQEKNHTKSKLQEFKQQYFLEKENIRKQYNNEKEYKDKLMQCNYQMYQEKAKITSKLSEYLVLKSSIIKNYKDQKKNNINIYSNQLTFNKKQIINPNNYFYKYINSFQIMLMILLLIVGLWAIVLGTFGISTNASFFVVNIDLLLPQLDGYNASYISAFNTWKQIAIADNYGLSLSTLIFGVISIILVIPLKLYKVSNIYYENQAKFIFGFALIVFILVLIIAAISFKNIDAYVKLSTSAEALNNEFLSFSILNDGLKTPGDFNNTKDYDSYVYNMGQQLKKWTGSDALTDANLIAAKAEAIKVISLNFKNLVISGV